MTISNKCPPLRVGDGIVFTAFSRSVRNATIISAKEDSLYFDAADSLGNLYFDFIPVQINQLYRGGVLIWSVEE